MFLREAATSLRSGPEHCGGDRQGKTISSERAVTRAGPGQAAALAMAFVEAKQEPEGGVERKNLAAAEPLDLPERAVGRPHVAAPAAKAVATRLIGLW